MSDHKGLLKQFFQTHFPLHQEGLEELIAAFVPKSYSKNSLLLIQGNVENKLRFITNGAIREFYYTEKKEVNIHFFVRPQFITDFSSFIESYPTKKNQETLMNTDFLEIDQFIFNRLLAKFSCGGSLVETVFRRIVRAKEQEEFIKKTMEPEELYMAMLNSHSDWLKKIPQYHIASYLGITPETLSRIRKRIS